MNPRSEKPANSGPTEHPALPTELPKALPLKLASVVPAGQPSGKRAPTVISKYLRSSWVYGFLAVVAFAIIVAIAINENPGHYPVPRTDLKSPVKEEKAQRPTEKIPGQLTSTDSQKPQEAIDDSGRTSGKTAKESESSSPIDAVTIAPSEKVNPSTSAETRKDAKAEQAYETKEDTPFLANIGTEKQPLKDRSSLVDVKKDDKKAQTIETLNEDPAVKLVLGEERKHYNDNGFKDVQLGVSFEELLKKGRIPKRSAIEPWVFWSDKEGREQFVFDEQKALILYLKRLDGGSADYLTRIIETFGETDRPVESRTRNGQNIAIKRDAIDYTFPKVLVKVVFEETALLKENGGIDKKQSTLLGVISKDWETRILIKSAVTKRKDVKWIRALADTVGNSPVTDIEKLPKLDPQVNAERIWNNLMTMKFTDMARKDHPVIASIYYAKVVENGRPVGPVNVISYFFDRHSTNASEEVFCQRENPPRIYPNRGINKNALYLTPFAKLGTDLNVLLLQEVFPPTNGKYQLVTSKGRDSYEWVTDDGWKVKVMFDDTIAIQWVGMIPKKDL